MLRSPTAYYGEGMPTAGEAYSAHTARTLNTMCHNQEECNGTDPLLLICDIPQCFFKINQIVELLASS